MGIYNGLAIKATVDLSQESDELVSCLYDVLCPGHDDLSKYWSTHSKMATRFKISEYAFSRLDSNAVCEIEWEHKVSVRGNSRYAKDFQYVSRGKADSGSLRGFVNLVSKGIKDENPFAALLFETTGNVRKLEIFHMENDVLTSTIVDGAGYMDVDILAADFWEKSNA